MCGNSADPPDFCHFIQASPASKGANANIDKFSKKTHLASKELNRLPNEGVQGRYLKRKSAFFLPIATCWPLIKTVKQS